MFPITQAYSSLLTDLMTKLDIGNLSVSRPTCTCACMSKCVGMKEDYVYIYIYIILYIQIYLLLKNLWNKVKLKPKSQSIF